MNRSENMERNSHDYSSFLRTLPQLPVRNELGHKGTYGTSFLIGGSRGMSGAIALAGRAALLAGSGLVRLAVPDPILESVAAHTMEYTIHPMTADRAGRFSIDAVRSLYEFATGATAIACGPGLGISDGLNALVRDLFLNVKAPLVLDADGLNALANELNSLKKEKVLLPGTRILTPHPGEFARLAGFKPSQDDQTRTEAAIRFVNECLERFSFLDPKLDRLILVLKGHHTIITDGDELFINETGNPGMATGGSGDVLTGLITGFLAQRFPLMNAVRWATALHGTAGDLAAAVLPLESILASDLLRFFPLALNQLRSLTDQTGKKS